MTTQQHFENLETLIKQLIILKNNNPNPTTNPHYITALRALTNIYLDNPPTPTETTQPPNTEPDPELPLWTTPKTQAEHQIRKIYKQAQQDNTTPPGRRTLHSYLKTQNIHVSDYQIRKILEKIQHPKHPWPYPKPQHTVTKQQLH